ncbi:1,2-phenylacetyl-CoA epoxidase subunit PaaC [Conexibacter woesei]|uniref:Phenylacetate-CoA oxygenase, PaaI subunit n=1 Tax=Conexibacter woesei (strain DSM 14684 / CCUG 47730 / CIP 108061 / JCM 11494 / NBRC 100937 / ID131577) TaxID=469383 RepID=D3F5F8_CONWI|nr:1,2-phenylacetyl-CoA epoxidase subunit PaaC [Conexibacter woesei]ADB50625.1 phenylacetate-CoA oxygenase, PaaI subunit [Conexibacter woesei DSM 14684]
MNDVATYALRLGDDALILSQRLAWWSARAPELEEDLALTNVALDLLGQARPLLARAGELEGRGRDEDALAYLRGEREFLNLLIVELPDRDFAEAIARLLLFSTFQLARCEALTGSADELIAGVAAKAVKEVAYHRDHAVRWTLRLGDGTEESHARMQAAIERLWPYAHEPFAADELDLRMAGEGVGVDPATLRDGWRAFVAETLGRATLGVPADGWAPSGGRRGEHTEGFGFLLAELQSLHRAHVGATW